MGNPNRLEFTLSKITIVDADGNGYFDPPASCVERQVDRTRDHYEYEGMPVCPGHGAILELWAKLDMTGRVPLRWFDLVATAIRQVSDLYKRREMLEEGIFSLRKLGASAVPVLMKILREKNDRLNIAAINALEYIGKGAVAAAQLLIVLAQKNISPEIRRAAAYAIGRVAPKDAAEALVEILKYDTEPLVRVAAAVTLARIGERASVPTLLGVANTDPNPMVRAAVRFALEKLAARKIKIGIEK